MFRNVKGMPDLLPQEVAKWQQLEAQLHRCVQTYGYREIRTPVLEDVGLVQHSVGEHTDIVQKEMYSFVDQGDQHLCLRPEATASVMRAWHQHRLDQVSQLSRLYYMGAMFRRERPQKGRLRQFHQLGVEAIGCQDPYVDVEVIALLVDLARSFGLKDLQLVVNSLGDHESRQSYRDTLQTYLRTYQEDFSQQERVRIENNPLRVLDSKNPDVAEILSNAPRITDHLTSEANRHFQMVQQGLHDLGISHVVDPTLVRGLDYYSHTAFELMASGLGAQNTVGAGGRYDGLGKKFSAKDVPAIGFAVGLERLMLLAEQTWTFAEPVPSIDIIAVEESQRGYALTLAQNLRQNNFIQNLPCEVRVLWEASSVKSALRISNKNNSRWVLLVGPDEVKSNSVTIKDFKKGTQEQVATSKLATYIKENVNV
ncbi:MAG: histidine--tRNA ligase [Bdellovibrionota bacterium]